MPGVHVGLDFENEAGEFRMIGGDLGAGHDARGGRGRMTQKTVQEQLHSEVVDAAAKKDGRRFAGQDGGFVEGFAGRIEHFQFFGDFGECLGGQPVADEGIVKPADLDWGAELAADGAFEQKDLAAAPVEDALELETVANGPVDRKGADAQDTLQFIEQRKRRAHGAVTLVDEGEDGHAAPPAHLEEFAGLAFDSLARVDDHDDGVHGGQDAISVLGEILVAWGVQEIDVVAVVIELQDGGTDGNAAFALQLHPIGSGGALVFAGGD